MENAFDRASFRQKLWKLMLPVVLQNLLSAVVSTADVFMLSAITAAVRIISKRCFMRHPPCIQK